MAAPLSDLVPNDMTKLLELEHIEQLAHAIARETMGWNEPIPPFKTRYPEKLEACLGSVSQTFDGKELYPTLVAKAAILFYAMVKNHPFQNGNKRVAVVTLLVFLYANNKWIQTDEQQLYNFAKWVAESPPELKDDTILAVNTFIRKNLKDST